MTKSKLKFTLLLLLITLVIAIAIPSVVAAPIPHDTDTGQDYLFDLEISDVYYVDGVLYLDTKKKPAVIYVNVSLKDDEKLRAYDADATFDISRNDLISVSDKYEWMSVSNSTHIVSTDVSESYDPSGHRNVFAISISDPERLKIYDTVTLTVDIKSSISKTSDPLRMILKTQDPKLSQTFRVKEPGPGPVPPQPQPQPYRPSSIIIPTQTPGLLDDGAESKIVLGDTETTFEKNIIVTKVEYLGGPVGIITVDPNTPELSTSKYAILADKMGGIKNANYITVYDSEVHGEEDLVDFWKTFKIDTSLMMGGAPVRISFKVPETALESHGYTYRDVILYHGNADAKEWMPLDTYYDFEKDEYIHYQATTNGASPFGVLFDTNMTLFRDHNSSSWITEAEPSNIIGIPLFFIVLLLAIAIIFGITRSAKRSEERRRGKQ